MDNTIVDRWLERRNLERYIFASHRTVAIQTGFLKYVHSSQYLCHTKINQRACYTKVLEVNSGIVRKNYCEHLNK
jgi:hypothetical protein